MITLLAIMVIAAQALTACIAVAAILSLTGRRAPLRALRSLLSRDALRIAWLVALVATLGSLYMSEVRHFTPCVLCWYQRIAMYPMAVILAVAAATNDRRIGRYVFPVVAVGAAISTYHYQLERFPDQETLACSREIPCTTIWFEQFGYITIPMMALSAFALVAALVWLGRTPHGQGSTKQA